MTPQYQVHLRSFVNIQLILRWSDGFVHLCTLTDGFNEANDVQMTMVAIQVQQSILQNFFGGKDRFLKIKEIEKQLVLMPEPAQTCENNAKPI